MAEIRALSTEQTTTLGHIATGHALLDGIMEAIIGALVASGADGGVQERARLVVNGQSTDGLVGCIKRLESSSPHGQAIKKWAQDVKKASDDRNRVLHAIWVLEVRENESIMIRRRGSSPTTERVSLDHLDDIVKRQNALTVAGVELLGSLGAK